MVFLFIMFLLKNNSWKIKKTIEKGYGVFAKKEIKAGTVISDYLGKVINIAEYIVIEKLNDEFALEEKKLVN